MPHGMVARNIKHPVFVGLFLLALGFSGLYVLNTLHLPTNYSFMQELVMIVCSSLAAAGGVMIFLHFVNRSNNE